ncbi:unnamed protein product [Echinostoma caproni]|uniref:Uncharacterized protein n=1 Tax=Echinostoma caproni TaxID=27848 RepID=A0A183A6W9_9TREM|nr:unnamed protein product [Echinostoma caproni]
MDLRSVQLRLPILKRYMSWKRWWITSSSNTETQYIQRPRRARQCFLNPDACDPPYSASTPVTSFIRQLGQAMVEITYLNDATLHKQHVDEIHFKPSTDQRHQETSEGGNQLQTSSEHPTEPHQSKAQTQPIETQGHRHEQVEPTITIRRSSRQASQIDEALLREESCGNPDFRDRNPGTTKCSFMLSNHRLGSSTNGTPGEHDIRVSTYDASAQTVT